MSNTMLSELGALPLNLDRFSKVCGYVDGGATEGERAAARGRATAMAEVAGLSFDEARAVATELATKTGHSFFPEMRTPEERYRQAVERIAQKRAVIAKYGSEEAVWKSTWRETRLEGAINRAAAAGAWHASWLRGAIPAEARQAVRAALPLPTTLAETWAEWKEWDELTSDRDTLCPGYSELDWAAQVRKELLEDLLDVLPARGIGDMRIRLAWVEVRWFRGLGPSEEALKVFLERMRADLGTFNSGEEKPNVSPSVQFGRRTNADKRRDVLSILDGALGAALSDREIARRVGVSPQTVNTIRRSRRPRV